MRGFFLFVAVSFTSAYWLSSTSAELPAPATKPVSAEGTRVAAEWEPVIGVLIGWPFELPKSLVTALAKEVGAVMARKVEH